MGAMNQALVTIADEMSRSIDGGNISRSLRHRMILHPQVFENMIDWVLTNDLSKYHDVIPYCIGLIKTKKIFETFDFSVTLSNTITTPMLIAIYANLNDDIDDVSLVLLKAQLIDANQDKEARDKL